MRFKIRYDKQIQLVVHLEQPKPYEYIEWGLPLAFEGGLLW